MLKIGSFTVTKTEGDLQPGEIDTVAIECYPEFVGSQEENIIILVPDSVPEDRNGKLIKLSVNSCIPSVNLQDLDTIFHENHIVNHIEDFICSKEVFNSFNNSISYSSFKFKIKLRGLFFLSDRYTYHIRTSREMPVLPLRQCVSHSYGIPCTLQSKCNTCRCEIDLNHRFIYTENYET